MRLNEGVEVKVEICKLTALNQKRLRLCQNSLRVKVKPENRTSNREVALFGWLIVEFTFVVVLKRPITKVILPVFIL